MNSVFKDNSVITNSVFKEHSVITNSVLKGHSVITNLVLKEHSVITNKLLSKIVHFSTIMAGPELFVITEFDCSLLKCKQYLELYVVAII
jgi:hypothetical protein